MQEKSHIKKNILKVIDNMGLSKYEFYKRTGITRGVLDQNNGMSEENTARFIAHFPEIDLQWLLTGEGTMYKNTSAAEVPAVYNTQRGERHYDSQSIPLYDIEASAGLVPLFKDPKQTAPVDHLVIPHLPKCDGSVYITGDSMYPLLKSGDIIAYKQVHDIEHGIYWGEMYLLSIITDDGDEYVTVKYIQKSDLPGHIKLVSYNKNHQDKDVLKSHIKALALVKASVRINSMS